MGLGRGIQDHLQNLPFQACSFRKYDKESWFGGRRLGSRTTGLRVGLYGCTTLGSRFSALGVKAPGGSVSR